MDGGFKRPPGNNTVVDGGLKRHPGKNNVVDGGFKRPPGNNTVVDGGFERPPGKNSVVDGCSKPGFPNRGTCVLKGYIRYIRGYMKGFWCNYGKYVLII